MNPLLKKVLGEESMDGIFPASAEELNKSQDVVGKPLRPIHNVVQEPSYPSGEKEKYLTPYAALTAPDCTPDSQKPIDPSRVPGTNGPERFTAADLDQAQEAPQTGLGQEHPSLRAMDVLMGHRRTGGVPSKNAAEFAQSGAVQTAEEAERFVAGMSPLNESAVASQAKVYAQTAASPGAEMAPPPPPGDIKNVLNVFRRFVG